MMTPEPILDVVRGLSTVASFGIVINQLRGMWDELFTGTCDNCRGAGTVICTHCHGTKSLRRRPAQLRIKDLDLVDAPGDFYPCVYCGPPGKCDFSFEVADNDMEAYAIMDNFKVALANRPRPNEPQVLAGTVPCPECMGHPVVHRHTPNLLRLFNLDDPLFFKITQKLGKIYIGKENRPDSRRRNFLEYPSRPPLLAEEEREEKKAEETEEGGFSMSAKDQLTMDDYVLPYVDDSDTEDEGN